MRRAAAGVRLLVALVALAVLSAPAGATRVTFVVRAPASTPAGATLYVSGDRAELGSWDGRGLALAPAADRGWTGTVVLPEGTPFEFKLTRGGWESVEKDAQGGELGNRSGLAHGPVDTLRITVANWRADEGSAPTRAHTLTGDIRRHLAFPSAFVPARDVLVWLPPGYDSTATNRYPVVYLLDGQNVFDGATSFLPGQEWRADEAADSLVRAGRLAPCILVAVANSPRRMAEYTSSADPAHGGGGSSAHQRFLIEELKPFIDRTYHTRGDVAGTFIVGSSLGGLASLDLLLGHSEVFGGAGSVSTSVWWAHHAILAHVRQGQGHAGRLWLDIGTAEERPEPDGRRPWVADAQALRDALGGRGWREGVDLHYEEIEGAAHNERAWSARIGRILVFLVGPPAAGAPGR